MTGQGGPVDEDLRGGLVERWLDLTRRVLPGMACQGWPIHLDHCFMRVCLDIALGAPWHTVIPRPAIRHATVDQLRRAIAVAERIVADPLALPDLNRSSLAGRRRARLAA